MCDGTPSTLFPFPRFIRADYFWCTTDITSSITSTWPHYQSSILNFPSPPWRVNWLLICWLWFQESCLETEITISSLRRERYVMLFWALAAVSWTHSTAGSSIVIVGYLILHGSCTRVRHIEVLRSDSLGEILQPTGTVNIAYSQLFYTQILVPLANRDGC